MIDGRRHAETFPNRQQAEDWEVLTRARAITGSLPGHATVAQYTSRWIAAYETAPVNTRTFHERNLRQVLAELGEYQVAKVVPTDITRFLNRIIDTKGAAEADRVYRTTSALFGAAYADGLCPNGSPVRSKRHRPRRQASPHVVLERPEARAMLLHLGGWQRDTALLQLSLGARFGESAGLTPTMSALRPVGSRSDDGFRTLRGRCGQPRTTAIGNWTFRPRPDRRWNG